MVSCLKCNTETNGQICAQCLSEVLFVHEGENSSTYTFQDMTTVKLYKDCESPALSKTKKSSDTDDKPKKKLPPAIT